MTGKQKQVLTVVVAIVAAFLIGFGWQFLRATALARELRATRAELALERLESTLGAATVHAYYGNYETARQLTSRFFGEVETLPVDVPPAVRQELAALRVERDALITSLARSNPESAEVLADHLIRLRVARGELESEGPTGDAP